MKKIESLQHPLVKELVRLKKSSSFRKEKKAAFLEGEKSITEIAKKYPIDCLISTNEKIDIEATDKVFVTPKIFKKISGVDSDDGTIAKIAIPDPKLVSNPTHILVADRIQDPGNLGTLIRSAYIFGFDGLFLITGSCDPYSDKTLRASKGLSLLFPIYTGSFEELDAYCKKTALSLVVAGFGGKPVETLRAHSKCALVLGNEGDGVKIPETIKHEVVSIPHYRESESLNVNQAGAILLYEIAKRASNER